MKYLKVFTDFVADMEELGEAERGRLFTAMLDYAKTGKEPTLRGNERFLWGTAKKNIDNQREAYEARCEINKTVATKRYETLRNVTQRNETYQDKDKEQEQEQKKGKKVSIPRASFVPPTMDEVRGRCIEMGYEHVDPESFVHFYASKGWKVGKDKMTDWKQALAGWESRAKQRGDPKIGETSRKNVRGRMDNLERLYAEEVQRHEPPGSY